jgi:ATP-dependent Clp protease adaptor protein ClpS
VTTEEQLTMESDREEIAGYVRPTAATTVETERPTVIDRQSVTDHPALRPWMAIVLDDPINTMDFVVEVFQRLFGFPLEEAVRKMYEVHYEGRSIVWVGPKERCELYVEQLGSYGLTATMEPQ